MRRVILISLLLHFGAVFGVLSFLHWRPMALPAEPARIEVLFGPGIGHVAPQPGGKPAAPSLSPAPAQPAPPASAAAAASPTVRATPVGQPVPPPDPAAAPSASPTPAQAAAAPGVRTEQPDPTTIPVRDDPGNHAPDYPEIAARDHLQGRVLLRLHIDAQGTVTSIETLQSSGHAVLDDAATAALAHWHFLPARRDGKAIASYRDQPVDFVNQQQDMDRSW